MTKESKTAKENETAEIKNVVKISESGPCKKKINIDIPEESIKAALDEQYDELRRDTVVPGFRKGRAPVRLIEKRFGSDVSKQVKLKLLADATDAAIKDNEIDSLGEPDFDHEAIDLPEKGSMSFEFEVEVRPNFKLPELKGIKVEKTTTETTEAEIDEEIESFRKRAGIWTPKEKGTAKLEELVVADAVIKLEGVEEGEKHDNIEIPVREHGFVGGIPVEKLDKTLVGAKSGDVKKVSVEVPKTFYKEEYRGKKVDVEMTVKEIKKLEPAALDETFFKKCGVGSLEELKEVVTDARGQQAEQAARQSMASQVHKYLLENTKFDLPSNIVGDQSKSILQRQYTNMLMQGMQKEQIDEHMEQLRASSEQQAEEQLRIFFIMDMIAEKLKVEVNDEEINGHIAQVAAQRGRRPEKMREELARDGSLAQFSLQVREQKCVEKLLEDAKITEVKAAAKKTSVKKAPAEKKEAAKKTSAKKAETKKTATKKTATKKPAAKKPVEKKAATAKKTKKKTDK
jgi:trigger factor